jgi:hypothetical protein
VASLEFLKSKTSYGRVKFFLYANMIIRWVLLFKDSISGAASPNRPCFQRDVETITSRRSEGGSASSTKTRHLYTNSAPGEPGSRNPGFSCEWFVLLAASRAAQEAAPPK